MAIVYQQPSWANGNSLFTSVDVYDRAIDGIDPLYPEIEHGESVTIDGGRLDWNGTFGDYASSAVTFQGYPTFDGQAGSVTARYRPNATSLADIASSGSAPLITLARNDVIAQLTLLWDGADISLDYQFIGGTDFQSTPFTFAADTDYVVRLCWSCGTPTLDSGFIDTAAEDGWIRVYINGTLVLAVEDISLYIDDGTLTGGSGVNRVGSVWFGYAGLLGELDQISFNDESCEEQDNPAGGGTCCSDPINRTPFGPPGGPPTTTPRIVPPGALEPPSYTPCNTGGDPADSTDPSETQSFTNITTPLFHVQITLPNATVLRYGDRAYTSGNGQAVTARVAEGGWGDLVQALATEDGTIDTFRTTIRLIDTDRVIRGHLADPTNRYIDGREAIIYVESLAQALLSTAPEPAARGIITSWRAVSDMITEIEISDPLGYRYSERSLDRQTPVRRIGQLFPGCPEQNIGRAVPIIYGDYSDDFTWSVNPARIPMGIVPVIYVGRAVDIPGLDELPEDHWHAYVVCGHAIGGIQSWFASNNHADGPGPVRMEPETEGVDFLIPGYAGYAARFANPYIDLTGPDGITERFTMIFGRGPRSDAHVNGEVPITLNVCGIEDVGDGSGDVITNLVSQVQHFLCYFGLDNYRTGNWGAVPAFTGGTPMLRTTSFDNCRTIVADRIGGAYFGAWYMGDQRTLRDWLAALQLGSDLRLGINRFGQIVADTLDTEASEAGLTVFDEDDIEESVFDVDPRIDAVFNVLEFDCALEAASGRPAWPTTTLRDEESITQHGERQADTLAVITTQLHANAIDIAGRRLMRGAQPIPLVRFNVDLQGLDLSLGQLVSVTHYAGIGSAGWITRTLRVVRIITNPNTFLCTIEAEDVDELIGGSMLLGSGVLGTNTLA